MARPAPNTVMAMVMTDVTQEEVNVRSLIHSARTALAKDCRPATRGRSGQMAASRACCCPVRDGLEVRSGLPQGLETVDACGRAGCGVDSGGYGASVLGMFVAFVRPELIPG